MAETADIPFHILKYQIIFLLQFLFQVQALNFQLHKIFTIISQKENENGGVAGNEKERVGILLYGAFKGSYRGNA